MYFNRCIWFANYICIYMYIHFFDELSQHTQLEHWETWVTFYALPLVCVFFSTWRDLWSLLSIWIEQYNNFICELRELLSSLLWLVHLSQHTVSLDYRRSRGLKLGAHAHGGFCAGKLNVWDVNALRKLSNKYSNFEQRGVWLDWLDVFWPEVIRNFIGFLTASLGV